MCHFKVGFGILYMTCRLEDWCRWTFFTQRNAWLVLYIVYNLYGYIFIWLILYFNIVQSLCNLKKKACVVVLLFLMKHRPLYHVYHCYTLLSRLLNCNPLYRYTLYKPETQMSSAWHWCLGRNMIQGAICIEILLYFLHTY